MAKASLSGSGSRPSSVEGRRFGRFVVRRRLGRGGMGRVFLATDTSLGRTVILKFVRFDGLDDRQRAHMADRFRREAHVAALIHDPRVAAVFSFEEINGRQVLVMEWAQGSTLRDRLVAKDGTPRALRASKAVAIACELLRGLEAVHRAGIVHRDLKPGNLVLHRDPSGVERVKILDFGLAKCVQPSHDDSLTRYGELNGPLGSPLYMSPEQASCREVDARSDLYAVGVLLHQMLTGRVPFSSARGSLTEICRHHQFAPIPPLTLPGSRPPPDGLEAIVHRALAKDPDARFASAAEMRASLEAIEFLPPPLPEPPPSPSEPSFRPPLALLALLLAPALVLAWFLADGMERPVDGDSVPLPAASLALPPPPESVPAPLPATAKQGCDSLEAGRIDEAIATLERLIASDPTSTDGLYCLCAARMRGMPNFVQETRGACEKYRLRPDRDNAKLRQVTGWLQRLPR